MGRGGSSGGSRGGGSRGFSSHRSSSGGSRGFSSGRGARLSSPSGPSRMSPPPRHRMPPPPPRHRMPPPPPRHRMPPPPPPPGGYGYSDSYGYRRHRNSGCCWGFIAIIAVIVIAVAVCNPLLKSITRVNMAGANPAKVNTSGVSVKREKLKADACVRTDQLINDELDWLTNVKDVEESMDYFYEKTGVQPYLMICDNLDGKGGEITDEEAEDILKSRYDALYQDEGHLIFAFMEYEESEYITFLYTGASADTVIDEDAREIFLNTADQFYTDSSLSDDEYFAKIFRESADGIMGK